MQTALDAYWYFASERQNIFFNRLNHHQSPYTSDQILSQYSFTNAYRASDRVSQYLIKNVIYQGDPSKQEVFFRILFFKLFNSIETWEETLKTLGSISYKDYDFTRYDKALNHTWIINGTLYSPAYIMPSGKSSFGEKRKHQNNLKLLEMMMNDQVPIKVSESSSLKEVYSLLLSYPSLGPFLAFQYTIDLNYSELIDFEESTFVIAGPGALSGIRKCFGETKTPANEIILEMFENQEEEFNKRGLNFKSLWGRKLQPIDLQNIFCETDKYCRVALPEIIGLSDRVRIKRNFNSTKKLEPPWYPPKWGLNEKICF